MSPERSTRAEASTEMLQQGARSGLPVLIPGALERRAGPPKARTDDNVADPWARPRTPDFYDRARLEREREGGGAPRNRTAVRPRGLLARLWRRVIRGPATRA